MERDRYKSRPARLAGRAAALKSRIRARRSEIGDTLVEVLIALSVIGLTAGALLGAFSTSIAATGEHHGLAKLDTVLKSFVETAIYEIQQQPAPAAFDPSCSLPNPYASLPNPNPPPAPYTVGITTVGGVPAVQYSTGVHPTTWGSCVPGQRPPQSQLIQAEASGNGASETTFFVVNDPSYAPANQTAPTITNPTTSNDVQTAVIGDPNGFNLLVTTTGFPSGSSMAISDGGATLPSGMTFMDNQDGTASLVGTPNPGSQGTYPMTFTASNGVAPAATKSFTLNVSGPPTITSSPSTIFTTGASGLFTVTTSGTPPANSITNADFAGCTASTLPVSVNFSYTSGTTATISGTTSNADVGSYTLCLNASNGVATANQKFTLIVAAGPNKLIFTSSAASGSASSSAVLGPITVQEVDSSNVPVTTGVQVNLSSSSTTGRFSNSSGGAGVLSITIPVGMSSGSFWYGDTTAGTPTLTVTAASPGVTPALQAETITSGPASSFQLASCVVDGQAGTCTASFTLKSSGKSATGLFAAAQTFDQFGNPATITSPITVSIGSSNTNFPVSGSPLTISGPSNQSTSTFNIQNNGHKGDSTTVTISASGVTTLSFGVTSS